MRRISILTLTVPAAANLCGAAVDETDATKRASATFGNPFGLALYDREQAGVRKPRGSAAASDKLYEGPWVLRSATGVSTESHDNPNGFVKALRAAMSEARDIEFLYDVWGAKRRNRARFAPPQQRLGGISAEVGRALALLRRSSRKGCQQRKWAPGRGAQ